MNYSRLFNNYSPQKKCGAEAILPGIGYGLSAIMGTADLVEASDARDQQVQLTKEENQKNRDFQSAEAEKNRQFAQSTLNQQMQYNSASEQVKRLQSAGINPTTSFSNSAGSAGSVTQPSPASAPAGSAIPPSFQPLNIMSKFGMQGAYLKSLAEAYKSSEEGSQVRDRAAAEIKKMFSEANLNEIHSQGLEIANMIAKKTGLRKAEADIAESLGRADLYVAQKAREIAQKGLTEAQTNREIEKLTGDVYDNVYKQFQARYGKAKALMAEQDLKFHQAEILLNLQNIAADTSEKQASSKRQLSEADVADVRARLDNLEFDIKHDHLDIYTATQLQKWLSDYNVSESVKEEAKRRLEVLRQGKHDLKDIDTFMRWLSNAIGVNVSISN